ncbi:type II secretion system protein [Aromatoleum buckelii]|uniref:Type II secretion system protein n=2 Tax=Aromatoleum buckelii TaxID=200254 RepID=A0ABX1N288_9RHOO|nr:type II secretion system protein [Aromatoleum buckelii]
MAGIMRTGKHQRGYTYLLVLFAAAALGLFAAEVGVVWQKVAAREREAELLFIGSEIARAIGRYHADSPGAPAWPTSLDELVEDRRFPTVRRHLRRIYPDPLTGHPDWGLVREGQAIVGIHSRATGEPIRKADLPPELGPAAPSAARYDEWIFRPAEPIASDAALTRAATAGVARR